MREKKIIEKESEKERTKDKEKNGYSSFHFELFFLCGDSFLKGFQKKLPSEEFKISNLDPLFGDEVYHMKEIEVTTEESKTLILSSMLNDEPNSYCNSACASNHAKSSIFMPKDKVYIKDQ